MNLSLNNIGVAVFELDINEVVPFVLLYLAFASTKEIFFLIIVKTVGKYKSLGLLHDYQNITF